MARVRAKSWSCASSSANLIQAAELEGSYYDNTGISMQRHKCIWGSTYLEVLFIQRSRTVEFAKLSRSLV